MEVVMSNNDVELTIEQIRFALSQMELNYSLAIDSEAYGLANAFSSKIDRLREMLINLIQIQDQYTSEADARYFEGV
jgi:hypothetical protein